MYRSLKAWNVIRRQDDPTLRVYEAASQVSNHATSIEDLFLDLSKHMIAISRQTSEILQETSNVIESIHEEVDGDKISETLTGLFSGLDESLALFEGETISSERVVDVFKCLNAFQKDFRAHLVTTKTLKVGFNIQGAMIPGAQKRFGTFAQEMESFLGKLGNTLDDLADNNQAGAARSEKRQQDVIKASEQLRSIKAKSRHDLDSSFKECQRVYSAASESMQEIDGVARSVADCTTQIVALMQTGDRSRQALEHVVEALKEINFDGAECVDLRMLSRSARKFLGRQLAGVELQVAQLSRVSIDLQDANTGMSAELDDLRAGLKTLYRQVDETDRAGLLDTRALVDDLDKLSELFEFVDREIRVSQEMRDQTTQEVARVSRLVSAVEETGFDMQVHALNAVINASQIGEKGAPLAVLAEETMKLSMAMDGCVVSVVNAASSLADIDEPVDLSSVQNSHVVLSYIKLALQTATKIFDETRTRMIERLDTTEKVVETASEALGGLAHCVEEIEQLRDELDTFLAPWRELVGQDWIMSHLSRDLSIYSMDEERKVHTRLLGLAGIAGDSSPQASEQPEEPAATSGAPSEDEDLGDFELFGDDDATAGDDSVELFDVEEPAVEAAPDAVENDLSEGDFELFVEDSPAEEPAADPGKSEDSDSKKERKGAEFGDNVELF